MVWNGRDGRGGLLAAGGMILLLSIVTLAGCSLFGLGGPRTVRLILTGSPDLNACGGQLGNALALRIYQLSGDTSILDARLEQLWQQDSALLGAELLTRTDRFLDPGVTDTVAITFQPNTAFLAVAGNFCNAEGECWRWMRPVRGLPSEIRLTFGEACIVETPPTQE